MSFSGRANAAALDTMPGQMALEESQIIHKIGESGFERLVSAFYRRISSDDLIGPLYPEDDLDGAQRRLADFLIQRFGGSARYSDQRGHPRLRMRHAPFAIGQAERDRWLALMREAMKECDLDDEVTELLWPYFVSTANHMMNRE